MFFTELIMYSVLDSLRYRPTQLAAVSKDSNKSWAFWSALVISEISSAKSVSVIYLAGCLELLLALRSRPFSLQVSSDILSM